MFNNTYKTIGLIICDAAADFQKQFCTHMVDYTRQKGYNLAIFTSFNDYTRNVSYMIGETNITNLVPYESFDGMIFISETFKSEFIHDKLISNIKNRCRCPIINVRSELEGFHIIDVDTDTAMDEMIRHFICTHKKEKIAFINGPEDHVDAVKRLECFRRVMKGYDLPIREDWIIHSTFWRDEGERYFNHFFDKPREEWPEVIMCANDHMALALSDICMDNGIEIPNDIAISGFDNSSVSATCYPPVSTVSVPIEDLAKVSVDVIERINNGENVNLKTYIGAVNIYRDSCGCYESDVRSILKGIREPRKEYDNLNDIIIRNTFMSIELEQVDEFEDIGPRLDVLGYGDRFINDFFVCICEDATDGMSRIVPRVNGYTSSMRCICAIKDRKNEAMSSFPTSSLIPINIAYTEPKQFYFTPLHFLDNTFGYIAHSYSIPMCYDKTFQFWMTIISNSMENIRNKKNSADLVRRLNEQYLRESMTGLYNRRGFDMISSELYNRSIKEGKPIMLAEMDMDNLKTINDTYGHGQGDAAIEIVARTLKKISDNGEVCARVGGDEFWVIAYNYREEDKNKYINKFYETLVEVDQSVEKGYTVSMSHGAIITDPNTEYTLDEYMNLVDSYMYIDKKDRKRRAKQLKISNN